MKRIVSALLLLMGIGCFAMCWYLYWERTAPKNLSFVGPMQAQISKPTKNTKRPIELKISALNLDLPIIPSHLSQGTWETTTQGVSYLTSSPLPGDLGNSILYGHDFVSILGKLPQSHPGEDITITYSDKSQKTFVITYTSIVSPTQIDILHQSRDARITLYTCTGFFDTQRFVVVALLKKNGELGYRN